jgi:hypothetical protein
MHKSALLNLLMTCGAMELHAIGKLPALYRERSGDVR